MAAKRSDLDVASKYLEAQWRGLPFFCGPMSFGFDQQHAIHAYPDRDGAFIESTGRNPAVYKFTAIFRNGIAGSRLLFPVKWQEFVGACADRTAGKLQHPVLGEVNAKCRSCQTSWTPERRDGADVELEFIEASNSEDELAELLKGNAIGNCVSAARDLDDAMGEMNPTPELPDTWKPSLLESVKALSGALAQFKMGLGNLAATVDSFLGACSELRDTIDALDDPATYRALSALDRLFVGLLTLADESSTSGGKQVTMVSVLRDSDLGQVAASFRLDLADLLKLNPALASKTTVAKDTLVFVYA
jgi:hypothetical protein